MKDYLAVFYLLSCTLFLYGQAPSTFNYQGVARLADGTPISNQQIRVLIKLVIENASDQPIYEETHEVTTNEYGLFHLMVGQGNTQSGDLESVDWSDGAFEIGIELDVNGSGTFVDLGTAKLHSVPYALYANRAGEQFWADGADDNIFYSGDIELRQDGNRVLEFGDNGVGAGIMESFNQEGNQLFQLTSSNNGSAGRLEIFDQSILKARMSVFSSGSGYLSLLGADGGSNISLTTLGTNPDIGYITLNGVGGDRTLGILTNESSNAGWIFTEGPNGNFNVNISNFSGDDNHGFIGVYDADGNSKAGMFVNDQDNGIVFADIVNTVIDHPNKSNQQISYSMLEGPEAAAYIRGTAKLDKGAIEVSFPEHYAEIINGKTITVMLTPLSDESKGLAVVEKNQKGFTVVELLNGLGSYSFDWEAKAVRRGYENYQVVRQKSTVVKPHKNMAPAIMNQRDPK